MTTTTTTPHDPAGRPPEIDAMLLQYIPAMRKEAGKYRRTAEDRADLVTDTIAYCLERWQNYRPDGSAYLWIKWQMRGLAQNQLSYRRVRAGLQLVNNEVAYENASEQARQEDAAELSQALDTIKERGGEILLRRAMGDTGNEIASDMGLSKQRVQQIEKSERNALRRRMGVR